MIIEKIIEQTRILPVIVIEELEHALPLAKTLSKAGFKTLEITLRSPCAPEAIRLIKSEFPDLIVGAGTVVDRKTFASAIAAGADFMVSPGTTDALLDVTEDSEIPLIPGVATPSEAMKLHARGFTLLKLFPAEVVGGVSLLKAMSGPLPDLRFCPTGGISEQSAPSYLAQSNVACLGGSWMAPAKLVREKRWDEIYELAVNALKL